MKSFRLLLIAATLLTACGSSKTPSPSHSPTPSSPVPCPLVTQAQVEKALGGPVTGGFNPQGKICSWVSTTGGVQVQLLTLDSQAYQGYLVSPDKGAAVPVTGGVAYYLEGENGTTLVGQKNNTSFLISVFGAQVTKQQVHDDENLLAQAVS
jgi:hypothetical protein